MKTDFKAISLYFFLLISCNTNRNTSLNNLVLLYDGKFSLSSAAKNIKLTASNNSLVEDGWLLPNSMANNCSIILYLSNPYLFKTNNFLEVQIKTKGLDPFIFTYSVKEVDSLALQYRKVEAIIKEFVQSAKTNNMEKARTVGYSSASQLEQSFISFVEEFRHSIPPDYKETQLIGFTIVKDEKNINYLVDAVLTSHNKVQKLINVALTQVNGEIKIKEIKF